MIYWFTILFQIIPFILYTRLAVNDKSLKDLNRLKSFTFHIVLIILIEVLVLFLYLGANNIDNMLIGLIKGTASYKSLEALITTLLVGTITAILFGKLKRHKSKISLDIIDGYIYLLVLAVIIESLFAYYYAYNGNKNIIIQEVCRKEIFEYTDENGEEYEEEKSYVVLYNSSNHDCYFDKLYLSIDEDNLKQRYISDITIPANSTYTFETYYDYLDISSSKETYLFISSDLYSEPIDMIQIPVLEDDTSYTLDVETNEYSIKQLYPDKIERIIVETPGFSQEGGFYDEPFNLYLEVPEGTTVYYTLDCTDPNENSIKYDGNPIYVYDRSSEENIYRNIKNTIYNYEEMENPEIVDKCFVIKAIAIDNKNNCSNITVESFFINKDKYKDCEVISIVSDPYNLFDDDYGIFVTGTEYDEWYVNLDEEDKNKITRTNKCLDEEKTACGPTTNYLQRGSNTERLANLEIINNSERIIKQNVGIRVQGNGGRYNRLKNLNIFSRKIYSGSRLFENYIFDEEILLHKVLLKVGFANAFSHTLVTNRDIGVLLSKKVYVFINGEFWYETYLLSKYDNSYMAGKYGLISDNISTAASTHPSNIDNDAGKTLKKILDNIGDYSYDDLCEIADVQSYIDFICTNFYLGNADFSDTTNLSVFKSIYKENNVYGDAKLRWSLYDMDSATTHEVSANPWNLYVKTYEELESIGRSHNYALPIYYRLEECPTFRKSFINTMMDLINDNFSIENVEEKLIEFGENISYNNYFFRDRPAYMKQYMYEHFELTGSEETVSLSTNNKDAGVVKLNTITPDLNEKWSGTYFTDYPVTLSADANKGYTFDHWEVNGEYYSSDLEITADVLQGGIDIYAVFN